MARKRFVLFSAVQPILKLSARKHRQKLAVILLALFTLISTLMAPILGEQTYLHATPISHALELEEQGKEYYETGRFAEAAEVWQKAADAYFQNEEGKNKNLIYKAKALQSLGLYPEACSQLLHTFGNADLTCEELIKNKQLPGKFSDLVIKKIEELPNSRNKTIGLRLFGDILQRIGELELSEKIVKISLQASEKYPDERSASLLSLGNIERAKGNKKRDSLDYEEIVDIVKDKSNEDALNPYKEAFNYYHAASLQAPTITQVQAELNQLSLIVEMKEWWAEQIKRWKKYDKKYDWPRLQDELNKKVENLLPKIKSHLEKLSQSREGASHFCKKTISSVSILLTSTTSEQDARTTNLRKWDAPSREAVNAQINFTHSLIRLNKSNNSKDYLSQQEIAKHLCNAISQARSLGDKHAEAEALSNLAFTYELQVSQAENLTKQDKDNLAEAEKLTQQALDLLNDITVDNRQLLYRQRYQLGRILRAQGNLEGALASYAEAWNILQSLRADLVTNTDNQFSFRQNVEPVYREFIDLLLKPESRQINFKNLVLLKDIRGAYNRAQGQTEKNTREDIFPEYIFPEDIARLVMESLQLAELDNFFQEPCSPPVAKPVQISGIDPSAAVIYPIILENRLEVILSRSGQPSRSYPTMIPKQKVKDILEDLANIVYNKTQSNSALNIILTGQDETYRQSEIQNNEKEFKRLSKIVYDWLIKPLKLDAEKIKTLVFVLDRPFQTIPIAALYDGQNYLIEKYNIVLNLGQELIAPKPSKLENIKILAAGVSKEGSYKGKSFRQLKNVKKELDNIKDLDKNLDKNLKLSTERLLDEEFNKKSFQEKIKLFPTIVHLATHGVFSSNREQTFILTGEQDSSIGINDFEDWLNPNKDRVTNRTIELLVLSACETALGDDRAALGFAGVVLRSKASSTIASLSPVSDPATANLMEEFYKNLVKGNKTRAEALRSAQQILLKDHKYNHPVYWAPFVLVGDWRQL